MHRRTIVSQQDELVLLMPGSETINNIPLPYPDITSPPPSPQPLYQTKLGNIRQHDELVNG